MKACVSPSRRAFLAGAGALMVSFSLGAAFAQVQQPARPP